MRPDAHTAMRDALALGPDHCPPDLFAGPVDAILLGLKAHANTIAHARYSALEETFPRTLAALGSEAFHAAASDHLADAETLGHPVADVGIGFADRLPGCARDLAAVELAWLHAYGAADAAAFDLAAIASLDAPAVASALVARDPAARIVEIASPLSWDGEPLEAPFALITRPQADVFVIGIEAPAAALLASLDSPRSLGALLEQDAAAATMLVTAGALTLSPEILL